MSKTIYLLFVLLLFGSSLSMAQKATIHGFVKDASNGESLISATVQLKGTAKGTVTNIYGFYSLSLEPGNYTLVYTYIGYASVEKELTVSKDIELTVELNLNSEEIAEVVISSEANNNNIITPKMGIEKIDAKTIEKLPVLLGEADVIKTLQLMPGVVPTSTLSSNLSIRGGARDQNLILLDDAPVYNASHLMGLFSVFNNDAIKSVELYKGIFPAQYGQSISSVIDVRMNEGNNRKFTGTGSLGLLSSKLTLETPLVYNKGSLLISGRRTYLDLLTKITSSMSEDSYAVPYYFYDLNAKANYEINDKNRVYLSGYFGRDVFSMSLGDDTESDFKWDWGNYTGTFRWNYLISHKLFMNTTVIASKYDYLMNQNLTLVDDKKFGFNWVASLRDYTGKIDLGYFLNPSNTISVGISTTYHDFDIAHVSSYMDSNTTSYNIPRMYCYEHTGYIKNEQKLGARILLNYGFHFSLFQNVGTGTEYKLENYEVVDEIKHSKGDVYNSYHNIDPRISMSFNINEKQSIKAGYARTHQYMHIASSSYSGTPLDVWMPVTKNIEPQYAHQASLGYFRNFNDNGIHVSLETYYKKMYNQIEFKEFSQVWINEHIEEEFRFGEGRAYGLELMIKKNTGKLTGWLSYTLSKTERKVKDIWEKNWYLSPYDQTHNLALVGMYDISKRWSISANFMFNTGKPFDAPAARFDYQNATLPYYDGKNKSRFTNYHRLDLSVTFKIKPRRLWDGAWVLSFYNIYNRKNADMIYFDVDEVYNATAHQYSYLPFIPSLSFNFKF